MRRNRLYLLIWTPRQILGCPIRLSSSQYSSGNSTVVTDRSHSVITPKRKLCFWWPAEQLERLFILVKQLFGELTGKGQVVPEPSATHPPRWWSCLLENKENRVIYSDIHEGANRNEALF